MGAWLVEAGFPLQGCGFGGSCSFRGCQKSLLAGDAAGARWCWQLGGNTSSLAHPLSRMNGLKAHVSLASAAPQLQGMGGCCSLGLLPQAGGGGDLPYQQGGLQSLAGSRAAGCESLTGCLQ